MGALVRATRKELSEASGENFFWEDIFAKIAEGYSLKALCSERAWAYGEVLRTVRADEGLSAAYDEARRGQAEYMVEEALEISDKGDDVARDKLRVDTRMKVAGKWDRARYGDSDALIGINLDPLTELLREISNRRLEEQKVLIAAQAEKVVSEQ